MAGRDGYGGSRHVVEGHRILNHRVPVLNIVPLAADVRAGRPGSYTAAGAMLPAPVAAPAVVVRGCDSGMSTVSVTVAAASAIEAASTVAAEAETLVEATRAFGATAGTFTTRGCRRPPVVGVTVACQLPSLSPVRSSELQVKGAVFRDVVERNTLHVDLNRVSSVAVGRCPAHGWCCELVTYLEGVEELLRWPNHDRDPACDALALRIAQDACACNWAGRRRPEGISGDSAGTYCGSDGSGFAAAAGPDKDIVPAKTRIETAIAVELCLIRESPSERRFPRTGCASPR